MFEFWKVLNLRMTHQRHVVPMSCYTKYMSDPRMRGMGSRADMRKVYGECQDPTHRIRHIHHPDFTDPERTRDLAAEVLSLGYRTRHTSFGRKAQERLDRVRRELRRLEGVKALDKKLREVYEPIVLEEKKVHKKLRRQAVAKE
jgi:hypothetical protein